MAIRRLVGLVMHEFWDAYKRAPGSWVNHPRILVYAQGESLSLRITAYPPCYACTAWHSWTNGHSHRICILATHPEGIWTTNPNPLSPSSPAQNRTRALVSKARSPLTDSGVSLAAIYLQQGPLIVENIPPRLECIDCDHDHDWVIVLH